jgi:hypothetical protein
VPTTKGDILKSLLYCRILAGSKDLFDGTTTSTGDAVMGWVLSMAVVEGLSAEEVAGRLEAELGQEIHWRQRQRRGGPRRSRVAGGRALILDEPYDDAPVLEDARLRARLSRATRVVLFQLSERVNCGFFQVGCWVDGAMAWQITHCREEPETEEYQILGVPPGIFADKAAPYRAQQAQADAAGEDTCYLGAPVVELFVSLTGIHYDRMVGGGSFGIGISGPSIEPQAEVT